MKKIFLLTLMALLCSAYTLSQNVVKGYVRDAETDEPLVGVSVQIEGTLSGTQTGLNGEYSLQVESNKTLIFSYVGYETRLIEASDATVADVKLKSTTIELKDVTVTSQIAIQRKTPVAVSNISFETIEEKLGNAEFPEVLKSTPGVYATKSGGGYGDSTINMRGFKSENIAVMVNGVPVNDMEWGGVYWSNWAGLSDVTRTMQTQRGLGASKVSSPSVGGSINIITKAHEAKKGGSAQYTIGNDGYNKLLFNISSGMLNGGWAFTVLGSRTWGNGYIQGTGFEGWNYFLNISKIINDDHTLSFTVFGAPQEHYQRSSYDQLTIAEWQRVGSYMNGDSPYKYNPTYGFGLNGQRKASSFNQYHKPQLSLNWNWDLGQKSSLSTVVYASIGRGNGYSGQGGYNLPDAATKYTNSNWYGTSNGLINNTFRNDDGTFAYNKIEEINANSSTGSLLAMSKSKNFHNWVGLISTYTTPFSKNIDFYGGVDFRYYKGVHTNELIDLYGGKYFIDEASRKNVKATNNAAAADPNWKMQKLGVGDVVYRDYDGFVMQEGAFAQVEGSFLEKNLNAFVAGSVSNTSYWRYDRFYYDAEHARSKTLNFLGYTVKGGLNYNFATYHNVFVNTGFIYQQSTLLLGWSLLAIDYFERDKCQSRKRKHLLLGAGLRFPLAISTSYHQRLLYQVDEQDNDTLQRLLLQRRFGNRGQRPCHHQYERCKCPPYGYRTRTEIDTCRLARTYGYVVARRLAVGQQPNRILLQLARTTTGRPRRHYCRRYRQRQPRLVAT